MPLPFLSIRNCFVVFIVVAIIWTVYTTYPSIRGFASSMYPQKPKSAAKQREDVRMSTRSHLRILTWNGGGKDGKQPWLSVGLVTSETHPHCKLRPHHSCDYLHGNRDLYNTSDAILFRGYVFGEMPPPIPYYRSPGLKFIFYVREAQNKASEEYLERYNNFFNVTMSFKLDADIVCPYAPFCTLNTTIYQQILNNTEVIQTVNEKIKKKTGLIAWFVSHCRTPGLREDYVAELRRYVPVDIYGSCGNFSCKNGYEQYGKCDQIVDVKYKFYLSFENALCKDYVTEKFTRMHSIDTVSIVRGLANYTKFAPPGTFIDIRDFPSAKELADYLKLLDSRDDLYAPYLLRKRAMVCKYPEVLVCALCKHLHTHAYQEERVVLREYWNSGQCVSPKVFHSSLNKTYN